MNKKWILFCAANYLLSIFFLFVFVFAIKAFFNPHSGMRHLEGARLLTICVFVIVLNTSFTIYVCHTHLPDRLMSKGLKMAYRISTLLFTLALAVLLWYTAPDLFTISGSPDDRPYVYFETLISVTLLISLLVLILQLFLPGSIEKKNLNRVNKQLDDIGEDA